MAIDSKFYPVPVYTQKHGFIRVEDGATNGATIGQDLLFFNDGVAGARELGISTGLLEGGKITINADPAKIDIAAGRALFVDFSQSEPTVVTKEFGPYIGVLISDIAIQPATYISIDKDLNVIQTSAELTNAQRRSMVELGIAVHTNRTTVNVINTLAQTIESTAAQLHDFMEAVGPFNKSGNVYSAVGGDLQLRKTAGDIFKFGVAYDTTPHDPHTIDQPSVNPITFRYRKRDSVEYADTTSVDPNNYDLGGVLTAVQANRYTVQRIYMFQSGLTRVQYGQAEYQTLNEAVGNFEKEVFETELNMRTNGILRAFLVVKQGATNLADPAQAQFFEVSKFGTATGAGGGGVDSATIIGALGYTPANQSRQIIAGNGLTGGGDLSADRTLHVGTPSSVTSVSTNSTTADSHTHALVINDASLTIAKTSGLQAALDSKVDDSQVGAANGVASLDSGGKIPSAQLPTLAITEVYTVASQAAMLALAADEGDVAIRTDLSPTRAYILTQSPASTLANWQDITGAYTDWSQVTNKPATFAPSAHTHPISDVTNLQVTLDRKFEDYYQTQGSIPSGADLNTYTTPGIYHQNANASAAAGTNYPVAYAGMLVVYAAGAMVYQTYQRYNTGERWHRSYYSGTWSAWRLSYDTGNFDPNTKANLTGATFTGNIVAPYVVHSGGAVGSQHVHGTLQQGGNNIWQYGIEADRSYSLWSYSDAGVYLNQPFRAYRDAMPLVGTSTQWTIGGNTVWHAGNAPISQANVASTLAQRNGFGDIFARLFRSEYANQATISGAMAYRVDNTTDNYIRFCSDPAAIRTWMGTLAAASPSATGNLTLSSSGNEFYRANANSATTTRQPRTFVQSGDPGAAAANGDLWIW